MLSDTELALWFKANELPSNTQDLIQTIRQSPPARLVRSGKCNVSGRYPSRKMGMTIQFESHRVELPGIMLMEYDPDVHEFYDQPNKVKLNYQALGGRMTGPLHTPDFFVLRRDTAGWEEWKTEDHLQELAVTQPNRYVRSKDGGWTCPPGEAFAAQFGLYYRVRSSAELNPIYVRNLVFLETYLQDESDPTDAVILAVQSELRRSPGMFLKELLAAQPSAAKPDDIYRMIVLEYIHVDLNRFPIAESGIVPVFADHLAAEAYECFSRALIPGQPETGSGMVELSVGAELSWNDQPWTILNVGSAKVSMRDPNGTVVTLDVAAIKLLVKKGEIRGLTSATQASLTKAEELMQTANDKVLQEAVRRYELISPLLRGEQCGSMDKVSRTVRRYHSSYKQAERLYGNGFVGLFDKTAQRGNRTPKLDGRTKEIMEEYITEKYETLKQQTIMAVYGSLVRACKEKGIIAPSYRTFATAVKKRPLFDQNLKRQGRRAAYKYERFYWEVSLDTPRHGDRPWEVGHIDHTELDVELGDTETGFGLGRPWATFLVDAFSRRLLAVWLTFEPPSYKSCMMVLRICVQRHNRLPDSIVVDGGAEFRSVNFEALLARYKRTKKVRPPAKARNGSVIERLFGTANTDFVHNLTGNTQLTKRVRVVTKSVDPRRHALWTLPELYAALCEWAYAVYDTIEHPALGQSPREAFEQGELRAGQRTSRLIPYDREFLMYTYPSIPRGRAKVQVPGGIKVNNIYYWSDAFRDNGVEGSMVEVRTDPFDASTAFAYVGRQWVDCYSDYYNVLKRRSEMEVALATAELRRRLSQHNKSVTIRASAIAAFLESVEGQEAMLRQRAKDREATSILDSLEGSSRDDQAPQPASVTSESEQPAQDQKTPRPVGTAEVFEW